VEAARTATAEQNAAIETLQEQIKTLQAELDESNQALEALRAEHANYSNLVAAAEIDRQALVKAGADLEAIRTETVALKAAQVQALDAANAKISTLEVEAARAEVLAAEIASLRAEKQETSIKFSELEVEILELKEAQDLAEGELKTHQNQINILREELATATLATEKAVQEAEAKERAAAEHLDDVKEQHQAAQALVEEEKEKLTEQLHASQAEIVEIRNDIVAVNAAAASAAEEHVRRVAEAKSEHQARQDELNAEIERISAELAVRGMVRLLALVQYS
jgi:conserved oligomeric Golgi complex subunit 6